MIRNSVSTHHDMMSWGSGGEAPRILDSSIILILVESFTSEKRVCGTHCIGGCVGPRTVQFRWRRDRNPVRSVLFAEEV
jgi:hypothetical protein